MYHDNITEKTKAYVETYPEIKKALTELCHTFKYSVLSHNEYYMNTNYEGQDYLSEPNSALFKRVRNSLRFLLVDKYNAPAAVFYISETTNKTGETVDCYNFISDFISKERGRGTDRLHRESIKLPALIKLLKKDQKENGDDEMFLRKIVEEVKNKIFSRIENAMNGRYHGLNLDNATERALIRMFFEQKIIDNPEVIRVLERAKKVMEREEADKKAKNEALEPFTKTIKFIMQFDECPMMIGSAFYDEGTKSYILHETVKYYSSPDDIPEEHAQLLVDYKMWAVKNVNESHIKSIEQRTQFKVFPITQDEYDKDLGIVTGGGRLREFCDPFEDFRMFVTPVMVNSHVD